MFRYLAYVVGNLLFLVVAMLGAPLLPLFAVMRDGPSDNAHTTASEPRLPTWLFWFDTASDNGLWGDTGWRTLHCPKRWGTWAGMVCWLWRNPGAGFCWSVLAHAVDLAETFAMASSGCGLDLDKSNGKQGWFLIRSDRGAFQFRWVKAFGRLQLSFEAGWLLDVYLKDDKAIERQPRAPFSFSPLVRWLHG